MSASIWRRLIATACAASLLVGVAYAAESDRQQEQVRRLQGQNRKLSAENEQLAKDRARLEAEKSALEAREKKQSAEAGRWRAAAAREGKESAAQEKQLADLKQRGESLTTEIDALRAKVAELEKQHGATRRTLAAVEEQSKRLAATVQERTLSGQACNAKNVKLYELNVEMAQRYRDKSCADALAQADPLTGLRNVEVFNILQEYRDKLDAQRIDVKTK